MNKHKVFMPKCKKCGEQLRFNGQGDLVAFVFLEMTITFKCKCGERRTCSIYDAEKENETC